MYKMYLLAAIAFTLGSCDNMTKSKLKGSYKYIGKDRMNVIPQIEFTDTKAIMPGFLTGKMALDYKLEDGYAYVSMAGVGGPQTRFKIVSTDTLYSDGMGCEGTYVRVQQ